MSIELTDVIAECNDLDAVHAVEDAIAKRYGRDSVGVVGHREIIAYRAGFAAASARAPSVGRVIAACAMLVPLLIEGWDEYDDSEDQRKGSAAVDELIAAWKEYDAHDQSERCSSKYTAAPRHGIAPMTSSDHHPAPSVPPSGTRGLNDWGRVAQVWHAGTVAEPVIGLRPDGRRLLNDAPAQGQEDGLVQRLREADEDYTIYWGSGDLYGEAADRIEADAARIAVAEKGYSAAVRTALFQASTNAELNRLISERNKAEAARDRAVGLLRELVAWIDRTQVPMLVTPGGLTMSASYVQQAELNAARAFLASTPATGSDDK